MTVWHHPEPDRWGCSTILQGVVLICTLKSGHHHVQFPPGGRRRCIRHGLKVAQILSACIPSVRIQSHVYSGYNSRRERVALAEWSTMVLILCPYEENSFWHSSYVLVFCIHFVIYLNVRNDPNLNFMSLKEKNWHRMIVINLLIFSLLSSDSILSRIKVSSEEEQ